TRSAIEQTKELISRSASDSDDSRERIGELNKQIDDKHNEIDRIRQGLKDSSAVIKETEEKITAQSVKKATLSDSADKLRSVQRSKYDEKENFQGQLSRLEESVKNDTADFDRIVAQLFDNYELTRSQAQEQADLTIDVTQANKRLSELKGKIKALGNVNLASIEEYQEVSERFETMAAQLDDVNNSKLQLVSLIDDLTEKMKEIFTESFDEINRNFKSIFTELFGGGRAELVLADPENVLECGIDIRVAPPGKVIKNLVSLSGGEQAFVAIAIYFAILKLRPSPFCLLDEIEAALDDVNVSRYAQYLHRFTDKTQFIAITHRRGTMEEADVLYGVTMQKGISKLLRMSPDEAYDIDNDN
ncbi:MAG: chromosome segregation protein SMC, partial [Ruminococcus sp.]|nr:chromosome segregation protein SMC [Ruminococcus sp.]